MWDRLVSCQAAAAGWERSRGMGARWCQVKVHAGLVSLLSSLLRLEMLLGPFLWWWWWGGPGPSSLEDSLFGLLA